MEENSSIFSDILWHEFVDFGWNDLLSSCVKSYMHILIFQSYACFLMHICIKLYISFHMYLCLLLLFVTILYVHHFTTSCEVSEGIVFSFIHLSALWCDSLSASLYPETICISHHNGVMSHICLHSFLPPKIMGVSWFWNLDKEGGHEKIVQR